MRPTNKVMSGALAGALAGISVWALKTYGHQDVPTEIGMAVTTVFTALVQYFVPDSVEAQGEIE